MTEEPSESTLVAAAAREVQRLVAANKLRRIQVRILAGVCAALILGAAILSYNVIQERGLSTRVQHGSVAECQASNSTRDANVQTWDFFLGILLKGNKNSADLAAGQRVETFIADHNKQRDCIKLYG